MSAVQFGVATHPGLVRENNEDSCLADPDLGLWIVADGMGGHDAGAVASSIAIREIARSIRKGRPLTEAIEIAHHEIQSTAAQGQDSSNMGSTVVALSLGERRYEIAWVGDSRAYLWNGALHQLTKDHSYVQFLLDAGLISQDEVAGYPGRNVITQGLGVGGANSEGIKVDVVTGELADNESLLLCSDGLSGELSSAEIAAILAEETNDQSKAERLIQAALEAGGKDNVTAVLVSLI